MRCFVIKTRHLPRINLHHINSLFRLTGLFKRIFKKRLIRFHSGKACSDKKRKYISAISVVAAGGILITLSIKPQGEKSVTVFNHYNAEKIVSDVLPSEEEAAVISYLKKQISSITKPEPGEIIKRHGGAFSKLSSPTPAPVPTPSEEPEEIITEERTSPTNQMFKNETDYSVSEKTFKNIPLEFSNNPTVLIIHTHTTECYTPENNISLPDNGRSTDESKNMIAVGKVIKETLESFGISVVHDTTFHDYPSYQGAYGRSLTTAKKNLSENNNIELILDIHRDAVTGENGSRVKLIKEINGEACAQLMIVCGTDGGGLSHPGWHDNLNFAVKLQQNMNSAYPGLMRPINLRKERFNQHLTPGSLIVEVGTHGNSLKEAKTSAAYIASEIGKLIMR